MQTAFTNLPRILLVSPGTEFCSNIIVGIDIRYAVSVAAPDAYPPTPITISGLTVLIIL